MEKLSLAKITLEMDNDCLTDRRVIRRSTRLPILSSLPSPPMKFMIAYFRCLKIRPISDSYADGWRQNACIADKIGSRMW